MFIEAVSVCRAPLIYSARCCKLVYSSSFSTPPRGRTEVPCGLWPIKTIWKPLSSSRGGSSDSRIMFLSKVLFICLSSLSSTDTPYALDKFFILFLVQIDMEVFVCKLHVSNGTNHISSLHQGCKLNKASLR